MAAWTWKPGGTSVCMRGLGPSPGFVAFGASSTNRASLLNQSRPSGWTVVVFVALLTWAWSMASFCVAAETSQPNGKNGHASQRSPQNPDDGLLILKGRKVKKLVLSDRQGKLWTFDEPGDRVSLPVGEYRIRALEVAGGFCLVWDPSDVVESAKAVWPPPDNRRLTIRPGQPCQADFGMPLKLHIVTNAHRVGRLIDASFSKTIADQGGRFYSCTKNAVPKFAVYKGGRDITDLGVGSLEYG